MTHSALPTGDPQRRRSERAILVSIHTEYAELILSGVKSVELRRRFQVDAAGSRMLIYATLPTGAVVGHVCIERVDRLSVQEIWTRHGGQASISFHDFRRYFDGTDSGCALVLSSPVRFEEPVPLNRLRTKLGLSPPQSYVILRDGHRDLIEHEQH